jgi:allophanate hydrolase subunit 1
MYTTNIRLTMTLLRTIECAIAIIVGCVPAIRALWLKYDVDDKLCMRIRFILVALRLRQDGQQHRSRWVELNNIDK